MKDFQRVLPVKVKAKQIDLSGWNFSDPPLLNKAFNEFATNTAKLVLRSVLTGSNGCEKPYASLPVIWGDSDGFGGPPVKDPMCVYVSFDSGTIDPCVVKFSFADLIEYELEDGTNEAGEWCTQLKDALSDLIRRIEAYEKREAIKERGDQSNSSNAIGTEK